MDIGEILKDTPYLAFLAGGFLAPIALFYPIFFIQLDAIKHGISANFAFYAVSILQAGNIFGRMIPQLFIPNIGLFNLQLLCVTASTILVFAIISVTNIGGTTAFAVLYGFFAGATLSLLPPILASFAKNSDEVGIRVGLGIAVGGFGGLIGLPIAGALLTDRFEWWRPAVFAGAVFVTADICFLGARTGVSRRRGVSKV